jgi:hypothetical protein
MVIRNRGTTSFYSTLGGHFRLGNILRVSMRTKVTIARDAAGDEQIEWLSCARAFAERKATMF